MRTLSRTVALASSAFIALRGAASRTFQVDGRASESSGMFGLPASGLVRSAPNLVYGRKLGVFQTYPAHHYKLLSARQKLSKNFRNHKRT